jgi:hypothetical protein
LRQEHRLRVFENRALRRIFGPKREKDRSCRKLHNVELPNLCSSSIVRAIKSRRMRWAGHVAGRGEVFTGVCLGGQGKKPVERPRHRWEDNIKMDLREIGIDGVNWILLAQDMVQWWAFVNTIMNLWVSWDCLIQDCLFLMPCPVTPGWSIRVGNFLVFRVPDVQT